MYVSFCRFSGPYEYNEDEPTKASTALVVGMALTNSTGLAPASAGNSIYGVALKAKASTVSAQTSILVMRVFSAGRTKWFGKAGNSTTFTSPATTMIVCDFHTDSASLLASTNSSHDFAVSSTLSSTQVVGTFVNVFAVKGS